MKTLWMIRDVEHGKTFSFPSYEAMQKWIIDKMIQENNQLVEKILQNAKKE